MCRFAVCDAIDIKDAQQLIDLYKSTTASTMKEEINLLNDLDFRSVTMTVPLGGDSSSCTPFNSTFHGNGYTIKHLNLNNASYMHSALFCNMVGATVENLVFDATCSFTGSFSGALSVAVSDQVSVINVTNKAKVIGNDAAGGLIGFVSGSARQSLLIDNCVNDGRIVNNNAYAGGFIWKNLLESKSGSYNHQLY